MVLIALIHIDGAIHVRQEPLGIIAQRTTLIQLVVHAVRLDISLVVHVEAILVAKLIEASVLRIVAKAHGIEVIALHQLKVLSHQLFADIMPSLWIMLVDIDALKLDWLPVEEQYRVRLAIGRFLIKLLHLDATETNTEGNDLQGFASLLLHTHQELVEVGVLRTPSGHTRNTSLERSGLWARGTHP